MTDWKLATASLLLIFIAACSGNADVPATKSSGGKTDQECPATERALSANLNRVAVRSGQIALNSPHREFNFSIELPDGWWVNERFTATPSDVAAGEIWSADGPVIRYETQSGLPELPYNVQQRQHGLGLIRTSMAPMS